MADGPEVNSELLAFFVEMAALEAEGFRGVRHVMVVFFKLRQNRLAFKGLHALGKDS